MLTGWDKFTRWVVLALVSVYSKFGPRIYVALFLTYFPSSLPLLPVRFSTLTTPDLEATTLVPINLP